MTTENIKKQGTTTVAINLGDRWERKIVFVLDNDQECITACWIDEEPANRNYDCEMTGTELYHAIDTELWLRGKK